MNNPYQNRPPHMPNNFPVPPHYDQRGPPLQQGPVPEMGNPGYHYPQMNMPNQQMPMPNQQMPNVNPLAQIFYQYANSSGQSPLSFQQSNPLQFPAPLTQALQNGLIPPPQLRQQKDHDETIDQQKASKIARESNEKQNDEQNDVREILWGEDEQANVFWEQKFFLIYEKFDWFGSRFEMLKSEYISLGQQLQALDSQEDWNQLKQHHHEFAQKLQEMFQQLIAVADQNQQLVNQRLEEDDGVWQKRYHELLSNFKALQQKTSMLEVQNQDMKTFQQQNDSQQQQGNYPELLSHYRNLQEEYQKLYNAYNKLQEDYEIVKASPINSNAAGPSLEDFENMRMEYQRTLEAIQGQNDQLKTDCQGFYQENQHFKEQLQIQAQAYSETQQLANALHEKEQLATALNSQLQEWKHNYEQLEHQLNELVQRESSKAQEIIIQLQNQLHSNQHQLTTKDSQYSIAAKKLQDELKIKEQLLQDHHEELAKAVKLESDKHIRQKQALQKQVKTLQEEYESLLKQSSEKDLNKYQIQAQEKRLAFMREENEQLLEEIRTKNVELSALRNVSLQLATYENILEQYKALEREKLGLEETSRKEHSELLQTRKRLSETEHEFSQLKSLSTNPSSKSASSSQLKHIQQQLSSQQQQASKLQSEVQKLRQLLEVKERYVKELEEESAKNMIQIEHQARSIESGREEQAGQVQMLSRKIEMLEKRNRASQVEFRTGVVENYEREVKELRQGNEQKLKKINKLQENLHQLTARSSHLQRFSSSHNSEHTLLQNKLTTLQTNNTELLSKLPLARQSIDSLQKQLSSLKDKETTLKTQLNSYNIQVQEADNLIKHKNAVILDIQAQLKTFAQKVDALQTKIEVERKDKLQKIKKHQQEMEKLKERLYSNNHNADSRRDSLSHNRYSASYSNRYLSFGPKQPLQQKNQQITKIQTSIIEQMNDENSKLRHQILELTKKINSLESLSRIVANNLENSPTKSKSRLSLQNDNSVVNNDAQMVNGYLEERLLKFNQRLEHCIQDNQLISVRDVDLTASQRIANYEREKRQIEIAYEKQIKTLKDQISTLTQQLNTQPASAQPQITDSDIKEFDKYQIMNEQSQKTTREQVDFLRSKLTQQQKTNSILIKLNQELKRQLQESFQKSTQSTSEYYKLQWKECEKSLEEERLKNKKVGEDNKRLSRENVEHDTKMMKEYELRIFEMEVKLRELERENNFLKMVRAKSDNDRANLMHDVNVYSADIETIKSSSENKVSQYEKLAKEMREKCGQLERELLEVTSGRQYPHPSAGREVTGQKGLLAM